MLNTGTWIKVKSRDEHTCRRPYLKSEAPMVSAGDQWRCDVCRRTYEVVGFDSGMQWDPFPTVIRWTEVF